MQRATNQEAQHGALDRIPLLETFEKLLRIRITDIPGFVIARWPLEVCFNRFDRLDYFGLAIPCAGL